MTKKFHKNPSKADMLQEYKVGLRQKPVSGTVKQIFSSFDDTTNELDFQSDSVNTSGLRSRTPSIPWQKVAAFVVIIAFIITVVGYIASVAYKYGVLETSVKTVQHGLEELRGRMDKFQDRIDKLYMPAKKISETK